MFVIVSLRTVYMHITHVFQKNVFFFVEEEIIYFIVDNEPRHEKTCPQGFGPGKTQIGLLSYRG